MCVVLLLAVAMAEKPEPMPDKNGVYAPENGVKPAKLIQPVAAVYPPDSSLAKTRCSRTLVAVIDENGVPAKVQVREVQLGRRSPDEFDAAAIVSVKASRFKPGTLRGKPVPVVVLLWIPFLAGDRPAIPHELPLLFDTPPRAIPPADAQNVQNIAAQNKGKKTKMQGVVMASVVVDEDGMASDVRVLQSTDKVGDEIAMKQIRDLRFYPATKYGVPIPGTIAMELSLKLY